MNNWNAIVEFYKERHADIMAERSDEWALDPYEWDNRGLLRMTPIEEWLWADLRSEGAVMYPQYPVGGVFVDFGNPKAKVAIECDGHAYHLDKAKDAARDRMLEKLGWIVYRFTGRECAMEFDEDEMKSSFTRRRVQEICDRHRISRKARNVPGRQVGEAAMSLLDRSAFKEIMKEHGPAAERGEA